MSVPEVPASLRSWMSAVSEIARAVNAAEPLDAVLTRVAEQACLLIGFEYCAVMLADAAGEHLQVAGWSGLSPDYVALVSDGGSLLIRPPGPHLDSPAARAFREGRTVAVPDVATAASYGRLRSLAPAQGYQGLLAAPLRTSDELAGVIVAYSVAAREFAAPEVELIELLAGQAALALETARLRTASQAVIGELSRANAELRRGRAVLEWAEEQHHRLMQLVLDGVGLPGLVTALAATLQASVTVEDAEGALLARAPEVGYRPPPDSRARRRRPARAALEAGDNPTRRYEVVQVPVVRPAGPVVPGAPGRAAGEVAWAAPVVLGGELVGRLWVTAPPAAPAPVQLRVVERFALVVGLELLKQRHLVDMQGRLSGDLLGDLLRPDGPARPQAVLTRAAALGHDLSRPHVLAVLAVDGPAPAATRLSELIRGGAEPDAHPLAGPYDGLHVLLLRAEPGPPEVLEVLGRILTHTAAALAPRATPTVVAGPVARTLGDYATAFRVARGAAALRRANRPGGLVDVRDLGLSALLLETGTPDALRRFARGLLQPLIVHEAVRGGDLLATLRAWLAAGCSTSSAAAALVVHPNTVGYRLARVEQLTGRSLRDTEVRLELQLALTIREIVHLDHPT
ncbi:helix-turn-helix domain-containing protein [Pseudonocardia bannensis]|uniref:GAF domain-containing protein n=1 Tax=Pseudonocardia bannensis TaxID=630973 RepID=A0A848DEJ0_9PSEU|nr:helix-turn-helix domain-containing protein [Pseudonocardia bannensis]NMH90971.1 GAF domain-containing protein [Pseudonocardia bannensis]